MEYFLLKEDINYKVEKVLSGDNNQPSSVLYIDPITSETETLSKNKEILFKYGAKFAVVKGHRRWQWVLPDDATEREEFLNTNVYPCIRELNQLENKGNPRQGNDEMVNAINTLIKDIDAVINARIETTNPDGDERVEEIKQTLLNFKASLYKSLTDEEFRKRFEPVLRKASVTGRQYSLINSILITLQDPDATYVHSTGNWNRRNRVVKRPNIPIFLYVPVIRPEHEKLWRKIKSNFLADVGKRRNNGKPVTEIQLTPQEQDEMYALLALKTGASQLILSDSFYDIRFTEVRRGKKDLVIQGDGKERLVNTKSGNENGDLKWFDDKTPESPESIKIFDALIKVIQHMGISVEYTNNLGGARGVSKGGSISILKNVPKNIGTCNTLIHELSHELFHHEELQKKDNKWSRFYLGRQNKNVVEQQAELCAWIVMRFLGYDMKTNINYLGNWGANEENFADIFDAVAGAADRITTLLFDELNNTENTQNNAEQENNQ